MARRRRLPATTLGYASPDTLERSRTARRKSYSSPDTQERATKVRVRKAIQSDPAARKEYINKALDTPAPNRREERQILGPQAARELNRARQRMAAHRAKVMGGTLEPTTGPIKPLSERETREVYGRAIGQTGLFDVAAQAPKEQTPGTVKKRLDEIDTGIRETFLGEDINRAIENTRQGKPMTEGVDFSDVLGEGALLGVPAPLRGVAGLRAGARAVKAGEGLTEASRATGEAYRTATPLRQVAKKLRIKNEYNVQSRSYYRNILRGADPEVLRELPAKPQVEDISRAFNTAISKGDFNAASVLQEEFEHLVEGARTMSGPFARGKRKGKAVRSVRLGEHEQQFPESPSKPTAYIQGLLDIASQRMTPGVYRLRESENVLSRGYGKALTPSSARGRVPKQSGKHVEAQGRRDRAAQAQSIRTLKSAGGFFGRKEGVEAAHFWYAQLPPDMRNELGLRMIRQKRTVELDSYLASGEVDREMVKSMGEGVRKLDELIANPPDVDDEIIDSMRALMDERTENLVAAGRLDLERASVRTGLVARWLDLEPSGEEVYVGHRIGNVRGASETGMPRGISVSKTRPPEGTGAQAQNRLRLAATGRVSESLETVLKDWQASQVYKFHNISKEELAKMGEPIVGRPKPGYVVINPQGHSLPRKWKVDEEEDLIESGLDPDEILISDVDEYIRNYIGEGADGQAMYDIAVRNGFADDLRQVPADVVKRYYGQFLTPKLGMISPTAAVTPGAAKGMSIGKGLDIANDILYTSLIYANPGYVPANTLANLLMAGAQQGAFLPVNLIRAGQLLTSGDTPAHRRLIDRIKNEVGQSASEAVTSGTSPLRGIGKTVSGIADTPYRVSAFIHEAARVGVIPKAKPWLDEGDFKKLERFLDDENARPLLNDVSDRATQAMVDFNRLGPQERALSGKFLFIWRWMRGGTRYPARFIADHPMRSALAAYVVAGAPGAPEEMQQKIQETLPNVAEGMPPWLVGALEAGETVVDGETYPKVFPTRTISPISTPYEIALSAAGQPGAQTAIEFLNPGLRAAWQVASKQNPFGRDAESYRESALQAGERLAPGLSLAKDLKSPEGGGLYPEDVTREGRLKRAARIFPIAIDPEEAEAARVREGMEGSSSERKRREFIEESKEAGLGDPPADVLRDFDWKQRLDQKLSDEAEEGPTRTLNYGKAARIAAKLYDEKYPGGGVEKLAKTLKTQGEARELYEEIRPLLYPVYAEWNRELDAILDARLEEEPTD